MSVKKIFLFFLICWGLTYPVLAAKDIIADDPIAVGTGARTLGMGRAFVAIADDVNAVFYNPAGLGQIKGFQAMSMSNSSLLLGELKYTTGAMAIPIGMGSVGAGVINKRIEDIPLLAADAVDADGRPDAAQVMLGKYEENITYISYGIDIGTLAQFRTLRDCALGLSIKNFQKKGRSENDLLDEASAQGYDLDIGMRSRINDDLAFGFNLRNVLDYQQGGGGGGLTWKTGEKEGIMAVYTFGLGCKMYDDQLIVALDVDVFEKNLRPSLGHAGVEWAVGRNLFLRTGWDQIPQPDTNKNSCVVDNIMPLGVGIKYFGFAADYAYYPAYNIEGNATHFFSVSFLGFGEEPSAVVQPVVLNVPAAAGETALVLADIPKPSEQILELQSLPQQMVVYSDSLIVKGGAEGYTTLNINGRTVAVENGRLDVKVPLVLGRNEIVINAPERELKREILRLPTLADVRGKELEKQLEYVLTLKDFASLYTPDEKLTRGVLAGWLLQAKGLSVPEELKGMFAPTDLLVEKGYLPEAEGAESSDTPVTRVRMALNLAYLEGMKDSLQNVPEDRVQEQAVNLLLGTERFSETDFMPPAEVISRHDALKLLAKTTLYQEKLKALTEGFCVPYLDISPSAVRPGDSLSIGVKIPGNVAVKKVVLQPGKAPDIILTNRNDRLWQGVISTTPTTAVGFYPVQAVVTDMYGNIGVFRDYYEVRRTVAPVSVPEVAGPQAMVFSPSNVLVNVQPMPLIPGTETRIKIGLIGLTGLGGINNIDAVILILANGQKVELKNISKDIWGAQFVWPRELTGDKNQGVFHFYSGGVEQGSMDYRFIVGGIKAKTSGGALNAAVPGDLTTPRLLPSGDVPGIGLLTRIVAQESDGRLRIHTAVGFLEGAEKISRISLVLPGNKILQLVKKTDNVWTGEVWQPLGKAGIYKAKFYIRDVAGRTIVQDKGYQVVRSTSGLSQPKGIKPLATIPVPKVAAKPVVIKPPTKIALSVQLPAVTGTASVGNKQNTVAVKSVTATVNVRKRTGSPRIIIGPVQLKAGGMLYIKVQPGELQKITQASAVFPDGNTPLKNVNGEWYGQYRLSKTKGSFKIKVYLKDKTGGTAAYQKDLEVM
jgi:hypothetical protein